MTERPVYDGYGTKRLGAMVRDARKRRGISRDDLAREIDRSANFVGRIELGSRRPADDETIERLAVAIGQPSDLVYFASGLIPPDIRDALVDATPSQIKTIRRTLARR